MFGARYYGSSLGRFMTPDWAAKPTAVPYAMFGNPQSLNLYSYVNNNPTTTRNPDGHCLEDACVIEGGIVITAMAVSYLSSPPGQQILHDAVSDITSLGSSISSFLHPDNSGQNAAPPPTTPTSVSQGTPGTTATNVATGTPASTSQQGAVDASAMQQAGPNYAENNIVQGSGRVNSNLPGGASGSRTKVRGTHCRVKVRALTPGQDILSLTTALDFEIMLTERRESIGQQV
jgi:RHS repeat-associated protein